LAVNTRAFRPAPWRRPFWKIVDYRASFRNSGQKKPPVEKKFVITNNFCFEPVINSFPIAEFEPVADIATDLLKLGRRGEH
jgi:hypothetical protein